MQTAQSPGRHGSGGPSQPGELALAEVLEQLLRLVRQLATAGELSTAAASVLARLVRTGSQRLTELANAEGVSQPGMTQLISRLERDGYVRRTASRADGRVVLVEPTPAGARLVERRRAQRAEALRLLLDRLHTADRAAIRGAIPALTRLIEARLIANPTEETPA